MKKTKLEYYVGNRVVHTIEEVIPHHSKILKHYCNAFGLFEESYDFLKVDGGRMLVFPSTEFIDDNSYIIFMIKDPKELVRMRREGNVPKELNYLGYTIHFQKDNKIIDDFSEE